MRNKSSLSGLSVSLCISSYRTRLEHLYIVTEPALHSCNPQGIHYDFIILVFIRLLSQDQFNIHFPHKDIQDGQILGSATLCIAADSFTSSRSIRIW